MLGDTGNKRAVRNLLECILVPCAMIKSSGSTGVGPSQLSSLPNIYKLKRNYLVSKICVVLNISATTSSLLSEYQVRSNISLC